MKTTFGAIAVLLLSGSTAQAIVRIDTVQSYMPHRIAVAAPVVYSEAPAFQAPVVAAPAIEAPIAEAPLATPVPTIVESPAVIEAPVAVPTVTYYQPNAYYYAPAPVYMAPAPVVRARTIYRPFRTRTVVRYW